MIDAIATSLQPGQLQVTWIYWCLVAILLADLFFLVKGLIADTRAPGTVTGPWTRPGPAPSEARRYAWMSLAIALLYGLALALRTPVAFWIACAYLIPALLRFRMKLPFAKTSEEIGSVIGALLGGSLQTLLILAGLASIDPTSTFPLRLSHHLTEPTA
jgi:hypothetical protein